MSHSDFTQELFTLIVLLDVRLGAELAGHDHVRDQLSHLYLAGAHLKTLGNTACPLLSARVVIRLSHRLHKGCNFFWSLSREKTGGERGEEGREHCEAI